MVPPTKNVSGCFGGGPGALNKRDPTWVMQGSWFPPGYSYEIGVIVEKIYEVDGKNVTLMASKFMQVDIISGTPPAVSIALALHTDLLHKILYLVLFIHI